MDYKSEYEFYYEKWTLQFENRIKAFFIKSKFEKDTFGRTIEKTANFCYAKFPSKVKLTEFDYLKELLELFNNRHSYYEDDEINLIFIKEVKPLFDAIDRADLPKNYRIKNLLIDFVKINVGREVHRLLQRNNSIFELHYLLNDFSEFQIRDYGNITLESYPLYKKLNKIAHPERYVHPILTHEEPITETDAAFKIFLLEQILIHPNWDDVSSTKKGKLVKLLIDRSSDNIKKVYLAIDKKKSTLSSKLQKDKAEAEKLIKEILG